MSQSPFASSADRRAAIRANAESMGITDEYISLLVDRFYERIRNEPEIGPIFDAAMGDSWDSHLATMKDFWASVAFNAGRYRGRPVPAHAKHKTIRPHHFDIWLGLFKQTLEETAPTPAVVPYFYERAVRIGQSLKLALFGAPELKGALRADNDD
ncbi:group III truncated hemoglobin [Hyphococcus sp. DH-69]|uniref:group III truncated hemoglobin n=1 Tax=Hyphococcus formosus TaxID=3143534 RepID=UPI00398AAD23